MWKCVHRLQQIFVFFHPQLVYEQGKDYRKRKSEKNFQKRYYNRVLKSRHKTDICCQVTKVLQPYPRTSPHTLARFVGLESESQAVYRHIFEYYVVHKRRKKNEVDVFVVQYPLFQAHFAVALV